MIKCVICEKELEDEEEELSEEQKVWGKSLLCWSPLYDGVIFKSLGNYGSVEYDPVEEREYLEIAICDKCLVEKGHLINRLEETRPEIKPLYQVVENFKEYKERIARGDYVGRGKKKKDESPDSVG